MAICARKWCDTFIFSHHGYHLERVVFDASFATEMLLIIQLFWESYVSPAIQEIGSDTIIASASHSSAHQSLETDDAPAAVPSTQKQKNQFPMPASSRSPNPNNDIETLPVQPISPVAQLVPSEKTSHSSHPTNDMETLPPQPMSPVAQLVPSDRTLHSPNQSNVIKTSPAHPMSLLSQLVPSARRGKRATRGKKRKKIIHVTLCGACGTLCQEPCDIKSITMNSIRCDRCSSWWHWGCVGIYSEDAEELGMEWICVNCTQH